MRILHINTNDTGGAAKACIRLHTELLKNNHDSKILVLNKTKTLPFIYGFLDNKWSLAKKINHSVGYRRLAYRKKQILNKIKHDFKLNDFLNACLNRGDNDFPNTYSYEIPEWTINSNKHDIDVRKLEEIKENLIRKEILNEYDLLGWTLYKNKLFSDE